MVLMKFMVNILINAQGEDVVAGTRTPQIYNQKSKKKMQRLKEASNEESMPKVFNN
jgi:pyruvate,orthophosphate dikinase